MRDGGFRGLYDKHSDTTLQLGLSIALGISAFLGFCVCQRLDQDIEHTLTAIDTTNTMGESVRCS